MILVCINHNSVCLQCEAYIKVRTEETAMFTQSKWPETVFWHVTMSNLGCSFLNIFWKDSSLQLITNVLLFRCSTVGTVDLSINWEIKPKFWFALFILCNLFTHNLHQKLEYWELVLKEVMSTLSFLGFMTDISVLDALQLWGRQRFTQKAVHPTLYCLILYYYTLLHAHPWSK